MPPLAPRQEELLALILDEVWDLTEAIDELERRRAKLRDHLLNACKGASVDRWRHPRGALRIDRYSSYKVLRPSEILAILDMLGWHDKVLQVKGRVLHELASQRPDSQALFSNTYAETKHEVLVLTPNRTRHR